MKKVLTALVLVSLLAILAVPLVASAVEEPGEMAGQCTLRNDFSDWTKISCPGPGLCEFDDIDYDCPACCLIDTVYLVTDWIFIGVLALVVIFVLIGAFNLLTAAGTPEKIKKGRDYIIYAAIGAIVAALAKVIPAIVKAIFRVG